MPVFNGESFLRGSIESILGQTYSDFEFIIIDDGSTDRSVEIINSYADPRIRLIRQGTNQGLISTLNTGISQASGTYIARMDGDDVSLPQRLERQVAFMDEHPEVGVCGTWFRKINGTRGRVVRPPIGSAEIKSFLLFDCPFAHPSVMLRRLLLDQLGQWYRADYRHAEDYDLWARLAEVTEFANLPEVLLYYREHAAQVSASQSGGQQASANAVRAYQLRALMPSVADEDVRLHLSAACRMLEPTPTAFARVEAWLGRLAEFNVQVQHCPARVFSRVVGDRWASICCGYASAGWWTFYAMWRSPLTGFSMVGFANMIKYSLKWLYLRLTPKQTYQ